MYKETPLKIKKQIKSGIAILVDGGLVAFPTDTVYGLGACFDNLAAVERIYRVKQRPYNMGLPLLVTDESQISEVVEYIPHNARLLIQKFMPGGLTLVMPRAKSVPDIVTGGGETVAVRIPAHPAPIALIKGAGKPIIGTSANVSGKPSAWTADEVRLQFGDELDLIIDGGKCEGGRESTRVEVTGDVPRLLREGAISRAEIERVCQII
ncbi:MAG: L-threonylcarbamoyladenylate synthase [Dehalococcoidales bacterium]|nr:L-threonylcarbamoyladenylate synthase [Dehalococcoidales bacterium]